MSVIRTKMVFQCEFTLYHTIGDLGPLQWVGQEMDASLEDVCAEIFKGIWMQIAEACGAYYHPSNGKKQSHLHVAIELPGGGRFEIGWTSFHLAPAMTITPLRKVSNIGGLVGGARALQGYVTLSASVLDDIRLARQVAPPPSTKEQRDVVTAIGLQTLLQDEGQAQRLFETCQMTPEERATIIYHQGHKDHAKHGFQHKLLIRRGGLMIMLRHIVKGIWSFSTRVPGVDLFEEAEVVPHDPNVPIQELYPHVLGKRVTENVRHKTMRELMWSAERIAFFCIMAENKAWEKLITRVPTIDDMEQLCRRISGVFLLPVVGLHHVYNENVNGIKEQIKRLERLSKVENYDFLSELQAVRNYQVHDKWWEGNEDPIGAFREALSPLQKLHKDPLSDTTLYLLENFANASLELGVETLMNSMMTLHIQLYRRLSAPHKTWWLQSSLETALSILKRCLYLVEKTAV